MINLNEVLELSVTVAREAGALLREGQDKVKQIQRKSSEVDLVTEYDAACEKLILAALRERYPDHNYVSEEGGGDSAESPYFWHIDPLDGTVNYAHGLPIYAVSIALYEHNEPLVGVIYDPSRDECFTAIKGEGAYLTTSANRRRLQVSGNQPLVNCLIATGFPYNRHSTKHDNIEETRAVLKVAQGLRRPGAAALDVAFVAAGRLDGYWEHRLGSYDVAAGILMVTEAGGTVTDISGQSVTVQSPVSVVVSNGLIHNELVSVLQVK